MVRRFDFYENIRKDGGLEDVDFDDLMDKAMKQLDGAMDGLDKTMEKMDGKFTKTSDRFEKRMRKLDKRFQDKAKSVNIKIQSISTPLKIMGIVVKCGIVAVILYVLLTFWFTFEDYLNNKKYEQKNLSPPAVEEVQPKATPEPESMNKKL